MKKINRKVNKRFLPAIEELIKQLEKPWKKELRVWTNISWQMVDYDFINPLCNISKNVSLNAGYTDECVRCPWVIIEGDCCLHWDYEKIYIRQTIRILKRMVKVIKDQR